jgi:hypothetical protein
VIRWDQARVAPARTHHLTADRVPLYPARFAEVLSFHAPGLAAARDASGAFHIGPSGKPAYARRFTRSYGFYDGLAAVEEAGRAFHILPDGTDLGPERYAWCGNFQGRRCTVRGVGGEYFHVDLTGKPLYPERHAYAGDFREGIAVVQEQTGYHMHIGGDGRPLNGRRFLDLDVFHKGYARARDACGWHHVNREGEPAYACRFAAAEPFYNGQSRVEREDGALEIIDERGITVCRLPQPVEPASGPYAGG